MKYSPRYTAPAVLAPVSFVDYYLDYDDRHNRKAFEREVSRRTRRGTPGWWRYAADAV